MKYKYYAKLSLDKNGLTRMKIPKEIYNKIRDKFIYITVNKKFKFLHKIGKENRFVIPKENRHMLKNKKTNEISIEKINISKKDKANLLRNNKIASQFLVPKRTRSGSKINSIKIRNELLCFYKSFNGTTKEIKIKRTLPLEFCRLLGYYQAEGAKEKKIISKKSRQVVFTNTNLGLIKDFIELSKKIIDEKLWKCEIKLKNRNKQKENLLKKELTKTGILKENIKVRKEERLKDFSIRLYICSTILSDITINFMDEIRYFLIKTGLDNENHFKMYIGFMQGLFAGDGNYNTYKNKDGGKHHRLTFYEEDKEYSKDYQKLLKLIGIPSKVIKVNNKNLFIVRATLNWNYLLLISKLKLFDYHNVHKKLLSKSIKDHKRYKSHKHLMKLGKNFGIKGMQKTLNKNKNFCYNWAKNMVTYRLLDKKGVDKWSFTTEGIKIRKILNNLPSN